VCGRTRHMATNTFNQRRDFFGETDDVNTGVRILRLILVPESSLPARGKSSVVQRFTGLRVLSGKRALHDVVESGSGRYQGAPNFT